MKIAPNNWNEAGLLDIAPINASLVDPRKDEYKNMILIAPDHIESGSGRVLNKVSAAEQDVISGKYLAKKSSIIYEPVNNFV